MFVIKIVMASLVTIVGALITGLALGNSVWLSVGLAVLAVVFLQALVLGYVVWVAVRKTPAEMQMRVLPRLRETGDQLFILPK